MNIQVAPWLEHEKEWPLSPEVSRGDGPWTADFSSGAARRDARPPGLIIEDSRHPLQGGGGSWSERLRMRHHCQNPIRWTPEVLSLAFGILCMAVVTIVLARSDGHPPPEMPLGITLNTFLAFFTSLAKVAYMTPIIEGLGQLKWTWFLSSRPKPLADFQIIDDASRGAWGSLKLLVRFKGLLSCLAAVITLSGLFTSTLTQQAISYVEIPFQSKNGTASVPRATSISLYNGSGIVIAPYDTTREKQALVNGAFFVPNETLPYVNPICSSGHCEWPLYGSLGICSAVTNLTAAGNQTLLSMLTNSTMRRVSNLFNSTSSMISDMTFDSYHISAVPASYPIVLGPLPGPTGLLNDSITSLLFSNHYLAYSETLYTNNTISTLPSKVHFLEIAMYICTKTFSTEVTDGIPTTHETASSTETRASVPNVLNFEWDDKFYPCYMTGTCNDVYGGMKVDMAPPPGVSDTGNYTVNIWTSLITSALVSATMYDALLVDQFRGVVASNGGGMAQAFAYSLLGDFMSTTAPTPKNQLENVQNVMANMAKSLTNLLRSGDTRFWDESESAFVNGTVFTPQTFVKIQWGWVTLLACQLFLASLFLVATIVKTFHSRMQIVKGSSLATLCGLDPESRRRLGEMGDYQALDRKAKDVKVHLRERGSGVVLVSHRKVASTTQSWWRSTSIQSPAEPVVMPRRSSVGQEPYPVSPWTPTASDAGLVRYPTNDM